MSRGRKPRVCKDDCWDTVKGIPTPLTSSLEAGVGQLNSILLRDFGLLEYEAFLKGREAPPNKAIADQLRVIRREINNLDRLVQKVDGWLERKRKWHAK